LKIVSRPSKNNFKAYHEHTAMNNNSNKYKTKITGISIKFRIKSTEVKLFESIDEILRDFNDSMDHAIYSERVHRGGTYYHQDLLEKRSESVSSLSHRISKIARYSSTHQRIQNI
jgi:hypothetical protein